MFASCDATMMYIMSISAADQEKKEEKVRMLSVAIRDVIQNIIHHLLVLVPGILSPNSIPPLHLLFQRAEGIYKSDSAFSILSFSLKKKEKEKRSSSQSWTTAAPGEIIIQNYDALISRLLKSNFGDYILCLCGLSVLQKLI